MKAMLFAALVLLGAAQATSVPNSDFTIVKGPVYIFHVKDCAFDDSDKTDLKVACWNVIETKDSIMTTPTK